MFRRFHKPFAWLALVAWLAASGLSWDLLQVAAWTKMSVDNVAGRSVGAAVSKALADAPCPMCKAAQEGRRKSEQAPLAKDDVAKAKAKADPVAGELTLLSADFIEGSVFARPAEEFVVTRSEEVPVPPPRLRG